MNSDHARPDGGPLPVGRLVSRQSILDEALALMEESGLEAVTMRALARRLAVDPMTPYHYFQSKDALLTAAAELVYSRLVVKVPRGADWKKHLDRLAMSYLAVLGRSGELLRYLTDHRTAAEVPAHVVDMHFRTAVRPLGLPEPLHQAAYGAFVDFVHGFSLALRSGSRNPRRRDFRAELAVILAGIEAIALGGRPA